MMSLSFYRFIANLIFHPLSLKRILKSPSRLGLIFLNAIITGLQFKTVQKAFTPETKSTFINVSFNFLKNNLSIDVNALGKGTAKHYGEEVKKLNV